MRLAKSFSVSARERDSIFSRVKAMLEKEPAVRLAYLFGSFAGSDGFNDIDLAVLIDERELPNGCDGFDYQLSLGVRLERELRPFPVDLVLLNSAPLPLRFRVVSEGELVLSKDEPARIEFETRTCSLFFDFLPHLEFYYEKLVLGR